MAEYWTRGRQTIKQQDVRIWDSRMSGIGNVWETGQLLDRRMDRKVTEYYLLDRTMAEYWIGRWQNSGQKNSILARITAHYLIDR